METWLLIRLAGGAVADLVVVLQVAQQPLAGQPAVRGTVPASATARVPAPVHPSGRERCRDVVELAEILVVAGGLAGEGSVQRVVEVVGPLRVHAQPVGLARADHARVVEVTLGDREQRPAELGGQGADLLGDLRQDVEGGGVDDRVDGVEAKAVAVVVPQPHQRVVDHEPAHLVRARVVVVDRRTPRRLVLVGEVRAVPRQVVARGSEVVVDDVHDHAESAGVAGVDQPLQPLGTAVRLDARRRARRRRTPSRDCPGRR